jgi:hypothetical protein
MSGRPVGAALFFCYPRVVTDQHMLNWFPYAFPFFFVGMWLVVTVALGFMSGWFSLQQWYADDGNEEPLLKLRSQSGSMGMGVALNGCLKLRATGPVWGSGYGASSVSSRSR